MSLANLQKALFFTQPVDQQRLLEVLQESGVVHLTPGDTFIPDEYRSFLNGTADDTKTADRISDLERRLFSLQSAIERLEKYEEPKGLAARFAEAKELAHLDEFWALAEYDETPVLRQIDAFDQEEERIRQEMDSNQQILSQLALLPVEAPPLEQFQNTRNCFIRIISISKGDWHRTASSLETVLGEQSVTFPLNTIRDRLIICIIGRLDRQKACDDWIESRPVAVLQLTGLSGTVAENVARLTEANEALNRQLSDLLSKKQEYTVHLRELRQVYDYWNSQLEQLQKASFLRHSRYTAIASGWVHADDLDSLRKRFAAQNLDVVLYSSDPSSEDTPPVDYNNRPLFEPFEYISDLYSRPKYWEIDPTPYLGVFFALFFGICLTDAGYGIVLALFTYWMLRKVTSLTQASRKLIKILFYSAICTVVIGALTGGVFGYTPDALPGPLSNLRHLVVLNPMENQMGFLVLTLILGIIHVTLGILLKMRWNLKHRRKREAWLDQAPWLGIILGIIILAVSQMMDTIWLSRFGYVMLSLAGAVILLFAGRTSRNPFKRLAKGLFSLYQVSGLFGDVLSYVRLFALGLATGVIAGVVNYLAQLTLGIPYIGFILMPVVFVFGHIFNLAINALGGFIHTTRLQFVEFFGKFFEGGGDPFEAFQLKTRYTKVIDQV